MRYAHTPRPHSSAIAITLIAVFVLSTAIAGYTGYRITDDRCESYFGHATAVDAPAARPVSPDELSGDAFPQWSRQPVNRALEHADTVDSPWGRFLGVMPRTVATDADIANIEVHPIPVALAGSTLHYVTEIDETPAVAAMDLASNTVDWAVTLPKGDVWPIPVLPGAEAPAVILQDTEDGVAMAGIDPTGGTLWCEYVTGARVHRELHRVGDDVLLWSANDQTSQLTRLDGATGELRWQTELPGDSELLGDSIDDDVILMRDLASVTAIDPATGEVEWTHSPSIDTLDEYTVVIDAADGISVLMTAAFTDHTQPKVVTLYAVAPDGETLWSRDIDPDLVGNFSPLDWEDGFEYTDLRAAVTIIDSTLLIAAPAKNDRDGRVTWSTNRRTIHAFDIATGADRWSAPVDRDVRLDESLEMSGDDVAVPLGPGPATTDGVIDGVVAIDFSTGVVGERYLDRMWIGSYVGTGSFVGDEFAVISSIDLLLVYQR